MKSSQALKSTSVATGCCLPSKGSTVGSSNFSSVTCWCHSSLPPLSLLSSPPSILLLFSCCVLVAIIPPSDQVYIQAAAVFHQLRPEKPINHQNLHNGKKPDEIKDEIPERQAFQLAFKTLKCTLELNFVVYCGYKKMKLLLVTKLRGCGKEFDLLCSEESLSVQWIAASAPWLQYSLRSCSFNHKHQISTVLNIVHLNDFIVSWSCLYVRR